MTPPAASTGTPISAALFVARLAVGVLLINLFVFVMMGMALRQGYHQYQERAEISTRNLTLVLESEINGNIETVDMVLSAVMDEYQQQHTAGTVAGKALNAYIERVRSRRPEIDALRITDAQGLLIYGNDVAPGTKVSLADRPHFIRLRDDPKAGLVISKPQISRINKKWVLVLARRIEQPDGVFAGMAFAAIRLDHFSKTFSAINVGVNGVSTLRDDEFVIAARYSQRQGAGSMIGQKAVPVPMRELVQAARNEATFDATSTIDNIERTYSFRRVSDHPLLISVGLARDDYLSEWRKDAIKQATLMAFFALVTLAAARLIYITWQRQRNALITVGQREESLKDSELRYRTVADFTSDWEYWIMPDNTLRYVSPSCEQISGYSADEFYADPKLLTRIIHPDDLPLYAGHTHRLSAMGVPESIDYRIRTKEGETRWISHTCRPVHDPDGHALGRRASNRDFTERKKAEEELKRTHADLRRFAEVTAHHLQEPARRMANYAERLTRQLGGRLEDQQTRLSLEFIGQEARREQDLLRDVERYLAADQPRGTVESVDARQTVAQILSRSKDRISAAGAEITVGELPPVRIDAPRLEDAFAVVLNNALSHGRGEQPLRITVEGHRHDRHVRYSVSDNGPGVEEEYREQVFGVFERLSSRNAGTGIGLAILRRVAESCHGSAWIEETPGGGCRVLFELPIGEIG